jgi:hypothetical protein
VSTSVRRLLDSLRSDDIPWLARTSFRLERCHMAAWGVFAGLIEGRTSRIVVAKTFEGSPLLITFVVATPMLANLLSLVWSVAVRGRSRRRLFILLASAAIASFASVGLTPSGWIPWGGWVFAAQLALAHVFLAGIINVRTSMWTLNYPQAFRARITGRLQGLRFLMALIAGAATALLFNADPSHYRWVYPLIGAVAVLSLAPMRRMPVRGERRVRRQHRERQRAQGARRWGLLGGLRESAAILREDRAFARYCTAQYLLGSAWLMMETVLTIVITTRLGLGFFSSALLLEIIPSLTLLASLSLWARYFDRVGVLRFRVVNSLNWFLAMALGLLGLVALVPGGYWGYAAAVALLGLSAVLVGSGRAGGAIAWTLGHLHFAAPHNAELYMGIHVALTGLRGVIMPFVGWAALVWLDWGAALIACALAALGGWMFHRLARDAGRNASVSADPLATEDGV